MQAVFENLKFSENESFSIGIFQDNIDVNRWHYHNNYEISFITEGSGKRIVGDSIQDFYPGDMVFLGKNLPHLWIAEKNFKYNPSRNLEMVSLQFSSEFLTNQLLSIPEFEFLNKAILNSDCGLKITGETLNYGSNIMLQLPYLKGFERMISFFTLLDVIGRSECNVKLAGNDYLKTRFSSGSTRIEKIHKYLMNNYMNEIDLEILANLVSMSKGSLCRFFKQKMGVTIIEYLNRIKIEFACKLLMDFDLSILEVCFDSGFNNLSHFNKMFKNINGVTPSEYRKMLKY